MRSLPPGIKVAQPRKGSRIRAVDGRTMFPNGRCDDGECEKESGLLLGGAVLHQCTDSKEQDHAESGYGSPRLSLIGR